jgi:hypothetical protein
MKDSRYTLPNPPTSTLENETTEQTQEQIRRRAYELYQERGREDGHELDDWLQAEAEVTQERTPVAA